MRALQDIRQQQHRLKHGMMSRSSGGHGQLAIASIEFAFAVTRLMRSTWSVPAVLRQLRLLAAWLQHLTKVSTTQQPPHVRLVCVADQTVSITPCSSLHLTRCGTPHCLHVPLQQQRPPKGVDQQRMRCVLACTKARHGVNSPSLVCCNLNLPHGMHLPQCSYCTYRFSRFASDMGTADSHKPSIHKKHHE
jgi:hypothetical protein